MKKSSDAGMTLRLLSVIQTSNEYIEPGAIFNWPKNNYNIYICER